MVFRDGYFSNRTIQAVGILPAVSSEIQIPTEAPTSTATAIDQQATPTMTPTLDIDSLTDPASESTTGSSGNTTLGIIVGSGLAILLIGIALVLGITRMRR